MGNRVVLVGAVHEAEAALEAIAQHPIAEFAGLVTLTEDAASAVSGTVDLVTPAEKLGVEVVRVDDVNDPKHVERIRILNPDLIAVVGWTRLIGDDLLALPPRGCIGFHASLLPHGRGRAPVNWSILRGEIETGNTMMMLNAGVDTGDIIDQRSTPIYPDDTCATVYDRVAALGAAMLRDQLGPLLSGLAPARKQGPAGDRFGPKRTPEMGVVDWERSPVEVHNWVRALTAPYPGAFSSLDGRRVMLWASTATHESHEEGHPGQVLSVDSSGVCVATRGGSVVITRASEAGAAPCSAADWAGGAGVSAGQRFEQPSSDWCAWARAEGPRPERLEFRA